MIKEQKFTSISKNIPIFYFFYTFYNKSIELWIKSDSKYADFIL